VSGARAEIPAIGSLDTEPEESDTAEHHKAQRQQEIAELDRELVSVRQLWNSAQVELANALNQADEFRERSADYENKLTASLQCSEELKHKVAICEAELERQNQTAANLKQIAANLEMHLIKTLGELGDFKRKAASSRWLIAALGRKIAHAPRDVSRRVRKSSRKRHVQRSERTAAPPAVTEQPQIPQPQPLIYLKRKIAQSPRPKISAIIPNFNHARFLQQRLQSITTQTLLPHEIVFLDDASTDDSREVFERLARNIRIPIKTIVNDANSGNVFRQWEKGIASAEGEILWLCESDDFADPHFLERLTPYFADPSVMISFGRVQFATADGHFAEGLDSYRDSAAPGQWHHPRVMGAFEWFTGAFAKRNVIPNVGGCLIRSQTVEGQVWKEIQTYRVCGDWYLYMHLCRGGQIAFDPQAISYFRQHGRNTSVSHFSDRRFYEEHKRIAVTLRKKYGTSLDVLSEGAAHLEGHFSTYCKGEGAKKLYEIFDFNEILSVPRTQFHIVIGILGFRLGGGELLPLHLANALVSRGYTVSIIALDQNDDNENVRRLLDNRIAVYEKAAIEEIGLSKFFETIGADLLHTHFVGIDMWMHHISDKPITIPYVVSHHGSYEITDIDFLIKKALMERVTRWVYVADKNRAAFEEFVIDESAWRKLPNAIPDKPRSFAFDRATLGIEKNAFIFGVASRALKEKGWGIAAEALIKLISNANRPVYVLFCGDGDDFNELFDNYSSSHIKFFGYQEDIVGFYQICDCCLLPTRFQGESFPLTLIEGLLAGIPCIATDIGEIRNMIIDGDMSAGILVPFYEDPKQAVVAFARAMEDVLKIDRYEALKQNATIIRQKFCFDQLVGQYEEVYKSALAHFHMGVNNSIAEQEAEIKI
jgi:glycosyltransferase involved in cell wall biosynthesis